MKALHLIAGKDPLRKSLHYIQVRGGFVYVTNAFVALKIPVAEVFGDEITEEKTLYFLADEWKTANMHKAAQILRDNKAPGYFLAINAKESVIGRVKSIPEKEYDEDLNLRYPDINTVIPDIANIKPIDRIALCPGQLDLLCKAMDVPYVALAFSAIERAILVFSQDTDATGICMPSFLTEWPWKAAKPDNDYSDLL
jgi:hypothetical protein